MAATDKDVLELRRMIAEPEDCAPYTTARLKERIGESESLKALAGQIWSEKAGEYAGLVDVQEGSSSRRLSQLQDQAIEMAKHYGSADAGVVTGRRPARTRPIVRP